MAEYLIQDTTLTGIADAIREKTGGTVPVPVSDMAAQIEGIQAGGGDIDALIERSITEISSDVTSIGDYAFAYCYKLTAVDFPVATSIGNSAFDGCYNLTAADFPVATSIGDSAFSGCSKLTAADFPVATSIRTYAFDGCYNLTAADFPVATSIGNSAFRNCSKLTAADFPVATSIRTYAFDGCYNLTAADFPVATSISDYAFRDCTQLTAADFPAATSIGSYAFRDCSKLTVFVLRSEVVVTLSNKNALSNTPIASGTGYIYVPRALLSDTDETKDYRRATNWSTYAAQFRALEDYTVDGTVTGELDPAKTGT